MRQIDLLLENFLNNDCENIKNIEKYPLAMRKLKSFINEYNKNEISWEDIQKEIIEKEKNTYRSQFFRIAVLFTIKLDENNLLTGSKKGLFAKNSVAVTEYVTGAFVGKREELQASYFSPVSIVKTPRKREYTGRENNRLFIVPNMSEKARELILDYLTSIGDDITMESRLKRGLPDIFRVFAANKCLYGSLEEYTDDSFKLHFDLIEKNISPTRKFSNMSYIDACLGEMINFYNWIQINMNEEVRKENFKIYTLPVLKYQYVISAIKNGFKFVNYSIYDEPPKYDKLVINPQKAIMHQTAQADKLISLDLSIFRNIYLKQWLKECYWFDVEHIIATRTKIYAPLFDFVKMIESKNEINEKPIIGVDDILSYKASCIACNTKDSTVARKLSIIKYFLNFINEKKYMSIDPLMFRLLVHHDDKSDAYKETYTKEEIKELLTAYKKSYEECKDKDMKLQYILYYYIVAILSISEMRTSTILNLKADCLVQTLNRNKVGEYKVVVQSKTSGRDFDEYNITKYVKELIDEIKDITTELREVATGIEKEYLFLYRRHNHKVVSIIRQDGLATYHKKLCEKYGIRYLQLGAIRNYYQQQVSGYVTENGDDPMLIERLSKHGINVHIQHYDTVDIKDFCQRFYQVEIGSIELKGRVEEENNRPVQSSVSNGCGHCELSECVLKGNLECLMCDKFVTTLECIPFFEKEIEKIDQMIIKEPLNHEKEFLNNKKRLNVAYLTKLYELEEKINENNI